MGKSAILLIFLFLSACTSWENSDFAQKNMSQESRDFWFGTRDTPYTQAAMQQLMQQKPYQAQPLYVPPQRRSFDCRSSAIGNSIYTNCY